MPATLRPVTDGLWAIEQPFVAGFLHLGLRSLVVRLDDGALAAIAPGPADAGLFDQVRALGSLKLLIAPNLYHHLALRAWHEAFPEATLLARPSLAEKRPRLPIVPTLGDGDPDPALGARLVRGMPQVDEVILLHRPSRTLYLTDLAFNLHQIPHLATRMAMRLNGGLDRFGPSRVASWAVRDKAAARADIDAVAAWDFDRVLVAHGERIETGGKSAFEAAFSSFAR